MTFTYTPGTGDPNLWQIRELIGDTIQNEGPRYAALPANTNFSDESILAYVGIEGSIERVVARLCEILCMEWAGAATMVKAHELTEQYGDRSSRFCERASKLRATFGNTPGATPALSAQGFFFSPDDTDPVFTKDLHKNKQHND